MIDRLEEIEKILYPKSFSYAASAREKYESKKVEKDVKHGKDTSNNNNDKNKDSDAIKPEIIINKVKDTISDPVGDNGKLTEDTKIIDPEDEGDNEKEDDEEGKSVVEDEKPSKIDEDEVDEIDNDDAEDVANNGAKKDMFESDRDSFYQLMYDSSNESHDEAKVKQMSYIKDEGTDGALVRMKF